MYQAHRNKIFLLLTLLVLAGLLSKDAAGEAPPDLFSAAHKEPLNNPAFAALRKRFENQAVLRAEFVQKKELHALTRPLVSSGFFLYSRRHGVVWHTREPFRAIMRISPEGLYQRYEGEEPGRVPGSKQQLFEKLQNVFAALFEGRVEALAADFEIYFTGKPEHWWLGLRPVSSAARMVAGQIVAEGGEHVQAVTILESSKDRTSITFNEVRSEPPRLLPDEKPYFDDEPQP